MLNRKLNIAIAICLCLLVSSYAQADDRHKGPNSKGMMHKLKALGVDASVIKEIKRISIANRKAQVPLKSAAELAKIELHELLDADQVDEAAVMKAIDNVSAAKTRVRKNQIRTMLKIRALLTPEQRIAFKQFREKRRGKRDRKHRNRR